MATSAIADAVKLLTDFQIKHGAGGKTVFSQTLQFYLDALKFDPKIIVIALENEINVIKSELDKIKQLRMDRIKSVEVCMANVTNRVMEQP